MTARARTQEVRLQGPGLSKLVNIWGICRHEYIQPVEVLHYTYTRSQSLSLCLSHAAHRSQVRPTQPAASSLASPVWASLSDTHIFLSLSTSYSCCPRVSQCDWHYNRNANGARQGSQKTMASTSFEVNSLRCCVIRTSNTLQRRAHEEQVSSLPLALTGQVWE